MTGVKRAKGRGRAKAPDKAKGRVEELRSGSRELAREVRDGARRHLTRAGEGGADRTKKKGAASRPKRFEAGWTVAAYIATLPRWQGELVAALRDLLLDAAPTLTESVGRYAQPVFEENGPVCFIRAYPGHVNLGFWRGAELADPEGLLRGRGRRGRHVRIATAGDIRPGPLAHLVRQAVRLDRSHRS